MCGALSRCIPVFQVRARDFHGRQQGDQSRGAGLPLSRRPPQRCASTLRLPHEYNVRLQPSSEGVWDEQASEPPPQTAGEAGALKPIRDWWLRVVADVVDARDVSCRRVVNVLSG